MELMGAIHGHFYVSWRCSVFGMNVKVNSGHRRSYSDNAVFTLPLLKIKIKYGKGRKPGFRIAIGKNLPENTCLLPYCKSDDHPDDHHQVNGKDNYGKDPDVTKMFLQVYDCIGH